MILNSNTFLNEVKIEPTPDIYQVNTHSLDLRIGNIIYRPDMKIEEDIGENGIIIHRKEHFLIQTLEKVCLPNNIIGIVFPRSSTNRRGLTIDMTGIVDAGYEGKLMLPISIQNGPPIQLHPRERIAQIIFYRCEPAPIKESKYQNSSIAYKRDKDEELQCLLDGSAFPMYVDFK